MQQYLSSSKYIDFDHPQVAAQAAELKSLYPDELELTKACFEFVRDEIKHSWDFKQNPLTCKASEALIHKTGFCFAKSHLLAALLRANDIPAGLCYQRLSVSGSGAPYCLHGLNAVYLSEFGWYQIDPRGNNPNVNAQFCPPIPQLAFPINETNEKTFAEIWPEPLSLITDALEKEPDIESFYNNLPDIDILTHT